MSDHDRIAIAKEVGYKRYFHVDEDGEETTMFEDPNGDVIFHEWGEHDWDDEEILRLLPE